MLARVKSGALLGVDAYIVEVEVDLAPGLPAAVGILTAQGFIPPEAPENYLLYGELSLDGRLKPTRGVLSMALATREAGLALIIPKANAKEAGVVQGINIYPAEHLSQVVEFLNGREPLALLTPETPELLAPPPHYDDDFREVRGQEPVKRALLIAAAGSHNVLMVGPPGAGKTMLARCLRTILPPWSFEEALETSKIYSIMGRLRPGQALVPRRPFRSPHHTISDAGLIGGGTIPRPGEVSLAHHGVLFLDELPEFRRSTLEVLRQPLEEGKVTISRAATSLTYPARFMLVAAMNPCPCGFYGDVKRACTCTPNQINSYRSRISGPLLDRIDIQIQVPAVPFKDLAAPESGEGSKELRVQVVTSREVQTQRFHKTRIYANAHMPPRLIKTHCIPGPEAQRLLETAMERLGLSARAYHRILKIARTIADLEGEGAIGPAHVAEAIQYRTMDRKFG